MKATDLLAWPMKLGAAVRHRRVFHPVGVLASGNIERTAPAEQGLPIESGEVLGRVSKAIGVPGDLPDLIGLALEHTGDVRTPQSNTGSAVAPRVHVTTAVLKRPEAHFAGQSHPGGLFALDVGVKGLALPAFGG